MAYEVVKRVGRRAYRYRVDSYRDPESKKARARWTYLGPEPIAGTGAPSVARRSGEPTREPTRERLLAAFERLLETDAYAAVTAGAVAAEARVAHGTFYRYFKDKRALLVSALERIRVEVDRARPSFEPPYGTRTQERMRIRGWLEAAFVPASRPGIMRAWYDALDDDAVLREDRLERRRDRIAALERYLRELKGRRAIHLEEPTESLAAALDLLLEAAFRARVNAGAGASDAAVAGVIAAFDRSIFGATRTAASRSD